MLNSRKEKIRGLWKRGLKYYAQLRMEVGNGQTRPKMIPLQAATLEQARAELEKTRTHYREGKLPSPGHRPLLSAFADEYLKSPIYGQKKKRRATASASFSNTGRSTWAVFASIRSPMS